MEFQANPNQTKLNFQRFQEKSKKDDQTFPSLEGRLAEETHKNQKRKENSNRRQEPEHKTTATTTKKQQRDKKRKQWTKRRTTRERE